ncbi:permease [Marinitoga sp. 1135]|uniref:Putative permease n=1 Tax=Marinitoga piezophila (strain DSM 14283 / JCM 11233 / KA3) TaxID=443254 RepID=H2J7N7_MARPK|nr:MULTISPECIES: permease [Marinitoga]AEX85378.1 putative permease [Marinitoga piezophila KA3]APT75855.1 permease [Marinitoga sp. 1137]NUU95608.1 permease [Marinitoga sp. 1135]NUU97512.1 permease [Marinitoga sp. 1138]
MNTIVLYGIAVSFLGWSIFKSKDKTKESLVLSKNLLVKTFIEIIGVMALVGLVLAILPPELIKQLLGNSNEFLSTIYGAVIGALTIIPAFIAFPLSKSLYQSGANLTAIAAFITTLTMVGFATMPIEIKYFGKKFTLHRLWLSFVAAILIATGMAVIL